jgi:colicin import membrane protein
MPRKLRTYITTSGFYDLAVAAPSMKAALEIWGSKANLFQQGFASETNDAAIVKAAMEHPGTILRRPVGTRGAFKQHADLPELSTLQSSISPRKAATPRAKKTTAAKAKAPRPKSPDRAGTREAAKLYDLAQQRREREEKRAAAQREKESRRQAETVAKAESALEEARARHEAGIAELGKERAALERRGDEEDRRWREEKRKLEAALNAARTRRVR